MIVGVEDLSQLSTAELLDAAARSRAACTSHLVAGSISESRSALMRHLECRSTLDRRAGIQTPGLN